MLNITTEKNESLLNFALEGRLDTVTAPQLSDAVTENLEGVSDIVMDLADLAYISSAGLRVLLTARKSITGELTLKNVMPAVMEVLEITGFADILTIE